MQAVVAAVVLAAADLRVVLVAAGMGQVLRVLEVTERPIEEAVEEGLVLQTLRLYKGIREAAEVLGLLLLRFQTLAPQHSRLALRQVFQLL
jgi:hypothetical protein